MRDASTSSPRETASFLSILTFSWISNVLKIGSQRPLEEKHLLPLETSFKSSELVGALEREWLLEERLSEQNRTKPRLWRAMIKIIPYRDYVTIVLLRILYSFSFNAFSLVFWFFLRSISSASDMSYSSTLPFVIVIFGVSLARSMFITQGQFKSQMIVTKLRVAVIGLVYKKILTLNRCIIEDTISENTINLVSNDVQALERAGYAGFAMPLVALDIIVSLVLVWYLVAWQGLIGVCFFIFVFVYDTLAAHKAGDVRKKAAAQTDKRLEIMKEIIAGIRVVKMYAWERNFMDLVAELRRKEISLIRIRGFVFSSVVALFFTSNSIAVFISIMTLLLTGHSVTSFEAFTLVSTLGNIKFFVTIFLGECLLYFADAKTACKRIQKLVEKKSVSSWKMVHNHKLSALEVYCKGRRYKPQFIRTESFGYGKPALITVQNREEISRQIQPQAVLENVSCFWNPTSERPALQSVSLRATRGQLVGITGPVGSGKTSLLMSLLGELPVFSGKVICTGKTAYVSQTPWVYSGTLQENIIFGLPFHEEKYNTIIELCDLRKDINSFPKRDLTEIGQRGVILSGGQRARVSLARAAYSNADIYLLDDPLSAVDAKVGRHLFDRCIKQFLAGRIRILVTHQVQFLKYTDSILMLQNGSVAFQGTYLQMSKEQGKHFSISGQGKQVANANDSVEVPGEEKTVSTLNRAGEHRERVDLTEEEEDRMIGAVKWQLYWKYFRAALPVGWIVGLAFFFAFVQVLWIAPYWWLARVTEMLYEQQKSYVTLLVYGATVTLSFLFTVVASFCFYVTTLKASENLHDELTKAVIRAPILFFDTNPVGRILNRFSKDIGNLDDRLPAIFLFSVELCLYFISATILSAVTNVWLFITCVPLTMLFVYLAKYYLKSSRELRRLEAVTCSPVYSLIADTVAGLEVIRSTEMEDEFLQRFYKYQDKNTAALIMLEASKFWLSLRGDVLSNFLVTSVSAGALFATQSPAIAGMSLSFAAETLEASQFGIRTASETENYMTSVERVFAYIGIEPEPGYNMEPLPPRAWPTTGTLTLQGLSLSYLKGAPATLKAISVCVAGKEKVGVAGRTGAGKSSLVAALFRMPEPSGRVIIDGVNIMDLNLEASRRSMAVITQDPILFSGSLRRNLDPTSLYDDRELWSALEEVQLKSLVQKLPDQLEYKLKESGSNFSVGERQLVCLARALLQKSKIIILDEATANVDYKTDRLIQDVLRSKFKNSTVLSIAHRLNTIMDYDKVLVMDQGHVVEFDNPEVLLRNKNGYFSRLVQTLNATTTQ